MKAPLISIHHFILIFLNIFFFYLCNASSSSLEEFIQCLSYSSKPAGSTSPQTSYNTLYGTGWFNRSTTLEPNHIPCSSTSNTPPPVSQFIYTPKNPSPFYSTLQAYIQNSRFNRSTTPKPLAIVTAIDYSHVQSTVLCARSSGLQLIIRSGGHDFEGMSYVSNDPFVLLDMSGLRAIHVDVQGGIAWAQAGATVGELYYKIAKESGDSLGFPAGVCPTVGLGGHFGGGGYGAMMRKYGLTIDHIIDAQVVDANGRILDRESMGEDLFWAIRGGDAASFCVVLSWKINLVPVPKIVSAFSVQRTLDEGVTDIVDQWQRIAPKVDHELFIRAVPSVISRSSYQGSKKKTIAVQFIALYLGDAKSLLQVVHKWFPLLGLDQSDIVEMSWVQSTLFWYELRVSTAPLEVLLARPLSANSYNKRRSDYVKEPIPREGLELLWQKMIMLENISMQWNPYGGRMSEIPDNATPFPHRGGNLFKMQYHTVWQEDRGSQGESLGSYGVKEVEERYLKATNELYKTLSPYVSRDPRGAFLNYRDLELGTNGDGRIGFALAAYFKGNVKRLLEVKAKVDPENFFRHEQSIPILDGYVDE